MNTFEQYLSDHKIDRIRLSIEAGVPYGTIWDAIDEKPIFSYNAQKIRGALYRLTGLTYTDLFSTLDDPPIDQFPILPIDNIPTNDDMRKEGVYEPLR